MTDASTSSNPKLEGELREYARQLVSFQEANKRQAAEIERITLENRTLRALADGKLQVAVEQSRAAVETSGTHPDTVRVEWLLRYVCGAEWRRLGAVYSAGMNRTALNDLMAPKEPTAFQDFVAGLPEEPFREYVPSAQKYAEQYKIAVTTERMKGWDTCLAAHEVLGPVEEPSDPLCRTGKPHDYVKLHLGTVATCTYCGHPKPPEKASAKHDSSCVYYYGKPCDCGAENGEAPQ